jgi:ribosomal protein S27E
MSTSRSRFAVTVTQLPVTRCQICDRTLAYRPGGISEVLTGHYRRAYPEALGIPAQ